MLQASITLLFFCFGTVVASNVTHGSGSTELTESLNTMIARGDGFYNGGKGVIVRDMLDLGLQTKPYAQVVPSTFWVNDIVSLSQMYVDLDGFLKEHILHTFDMVSVGVVVGTKMSGLFPDFDNIQNESWNHGVFYAHDSNSVDIRCRYIPERDGYDCPGGWIANHGQGRFVPDSQHKGTGSYAQGNPELNSSHGGGTGCHWNHLTKRLNEINETADGTPLQNDRNCKCNQAFKSDWSAWVDAWLTVKMPHSHWISPAAWYSQWGDQAMCWQTNVRDMILQQNALFSRRKYWSEGVILGLTDWPERLYEGWNEVPTDSHWIGNPENFDAIILKLPANICGNNGRGDSLICLSARAKRRLETRLQDYTNAGYLKPGKDHITTKPGSYVTVAREIQDSQGHWYREFFCESWNSPSSRWQVVYQPRSSANAAGACYVARGVSSSDAVLV